MTHLAPYDEMHRHSDIDTGGASKGDRLSSQLFPTFTSDPLNRLLSELRNYFSARYGQKYSEEEIQDTKSYVNEFKITNPKYFPPAYLYASRMEALETPNWLVELFNEHLKSNDWPLDDEAKANPLTSSTVSAKKRTSTQATLDDRVLGSNSKRRH